PHHPCSGSTFSAGSGTLSFSPSAAEALAECEARSSSRKESRRRRRPSEWAALFVGLDRSGGGGSTKRDACLRGGGSTRNTPLDGRTPVDSSTPVHSVRRTLTPQTPPLNSVGAVAAAPGAAIASSSTCTVATAFPSACGRLHNGGDGTTPVASAGGRGGSGEPSKRTAKRTPPRPTPADRSCGGT
ncbi:unnamed protein product, partial [Hapterophycus canaliculatus]